EERPHGERAARRESVLHRSGVRRLASSYSSVCDVFHPGRDVRRCRASLRRMSAPRDNAGGQRERPWIFRTYAGHSSPRASNQLFRANLAKGQTGLSIAFDLPTQCGYDSDHPIARPEVGKVGVPVNSLDDLHVLFAEIPIEQMNTSMTINATSMWLL